MKSKIITGILSLVTVFSLTPSPVAAYTYNGYCWPTNTVYFDIHSNLPTDPWRYGIASSAGTWNNCSANFNFYYDDLSSNFIWTSDGGPYELALTTVYGYGTTITDCDIEFNTYYSWSYGGGGGTYDTWTVALHEFGHWLSLGHNSSSTSIVMYDGYTGVKQSLHSDDVAGIVAIYGQ